MLRGIRDVERCGISVEFGVSEYTLVFRRMLDEKTGQREHVWTIVRPVQYARTPAVRTSAVDESESGVSPVFAVPICSALALEGVAYEQFLNRSGALHEALELLARLRLTDAHAAETTRKEIQSLVMAAEVRHIVDGMPA